MYNSSSNQPPGPSISFVPPQKKNRSNMETPGKQKRKKKKTPQKSRLAGLAG